ncbi:MAG: sigma 54-interacting transcriptional regulator [Opitutales bacterium]|nr:sigma 54-interacting transcriptional regulator [Opitutales bacterium]
MQKKSAHSSAAESAYDDLEMSVLHKISRAVVMRRNVSELIAETLEILHSEMGLLRGTITLREGDYLFIEASHGMDDESIKRGVYKMGEGVTGRVAAEGKSVAISDISKSSEFLDRTKTRGESLKGIAFVCVPIVYMEQTIGTLSIDRRLPKKADLERDLVLLETVANILADAVALIYLRHEERNKLLDENRRLKLELSSTLMRPPDILGNCGAMQNVYESIARFSRHAEPVLIRGKSGTGKELVARAIARATRGYDGSFKTVNCAALPDYALIGEIFGFEKDSFARAHFGKEGLLEKGGTIFLDEMAEISPAAQKMLADYISTGRFRRVNGKSDVAAKARLIFAASSDIEKLVEQKHIDRELYMLASKNTLHIPALRDRKSDIVLLAEHFLEKYNKVYGKNIKRISTPAINMLTVYAWPGNVRELENCIERAVMSSNDSAISGYNLTPAVRAGFMQKRAPYGEDADFGSMVASFERELITEALKANKGNAAAAARKLGITERVINYKIKRCSITTAWYKNSK